MNIYSVDKLIVEARRLAREYYKTTGKPLPGVSAEIALHDASRLLDLELSQQPGLGYDALGRGSRQGLKVQIKGRVIFDERKSGHRVGQLKADKEWDRVVLVLMDEHFEPTDIYEAERDVVLDELTDAGHSRRKNRGALSVAKFKNIAKLVWIKEKGVVEDEVWDNMLDNKG